MASSGEPSPPLQHQTCELKVSIHCEGCKKKVRRILRNIQGVLDTEITQMDSKQHKVVVTGTVPAEALIKKLVKSGKNAELWPEKKNISINTSTNTSSSNKNKDTSVTETAKKPPAPTSEDKALKDDKALVPATKTEAPKISTEPAAKSAEATESTEVSENSSAEIAKTDTQDTQAKESNAVAELTKPATNDPKVAVSAPSKISSNENSKIGDKEKKIMDGGDDNKKKHEPDEHPIQHQPQPVPVYAYSVAQPSMSYSHYAQPHDYSDYSYSGHHSPPPPVSYYSPYSSYPPPEPYQDPSSSSSSQQPGSYDMFNDENANSCNVM